MRKLIKNLKAYKLAVTVLLITLIIQAFGDISIPSYMQDMIDTGVQNRGVEHILPSKMTAVSYTHLTLPTNSRV